MPRYEFSFVVTDAELSDEVRSRVGRAVALAGAAELGSALPDGAVSAPAFKNEVLIRHWCGIPVVDGIIPESVNGEPQPQPWSEA